MDASSPGGHLTPERPLDGASKKAPADSSWGRANSNPAALEGTVLDGRYHIQKLLGAGGMSVVYKAHDAGLGRTVALKLLHQHLCRDRQSLERFLQEARTEGSVKHPNVLSVQSVNVTSDGRMFLIMDYLEGKSLEDVLDLGGPIPQSAARKLFVQLCDALTAAHEMNVVHRDLKPSNVMLVGPNLSIVKVVDFGIAKIIRADETDAKDITNGGIVGSPPYMSPEQCLGHAPDSRSDLYSMGCLMYETLTGRLPFDGESNYSIIYQHLHDQAKPFCSVAPDVQISPDLEAIVFQALEKEPKKRFADGASMKAALQKLRFLDETPVAPMTARSGQSSKDKASPRPPMHSADTRGGTGVAAGNQNKKMTVGLPIAVVVSLVVLIAVLINFNSIKLAIGVPVLEGKVAEADAQFRHNSQQSVDARLELADFYWSCGMRGKAMEPYRQALAALIQLPGAYSFESEREIQIAQRATKDATELQQALVKLGEIHRNLNNYDRAKRLLEASIDVPNGMAYLKEQSLLELAELSSAQQDYAGEQRYVEQGLKIIEADKSPSSTIILTALLLKRAECNEMTGRIAEAVEWLKRAIVMMPRVARIDFIRIGNLQEHLADCYVRMGREDAARQSLKAAIDSYTKASPSASNEIANCYRRLQVEQSHR